MRTKLLKLLKECFKTVEGVTYNVIKMDLDEFANDTMNAIMTMFRENYICEVCGVTHTLPKMYSLDDLNVCTSCYEVAQKKGQ